MIGKSLLGFSIVITIAMVLKFDHVTGQTVSPKLDFNDSKEVEPKVSTKRPSSPPLSSSSFSQEENDREGGGGGRTGTGAGGSTSGGSSGGGSGKSGPKIHGVRVTVDTGDNQNGSKESKESVEINEGKHKKRVGIHTDITFEITGDVGDSNSTSSGQRHDKEENDASVPIFKGRKGTTSRPRKPYDPRNHWNPNFSAERRRSGNAGSGGENSFRPSHYPHNIPVYPGTDNGHGDDIYRGIDSWSNFVPITSTWTTERSYYDTYQPPNSVSGYRIPNWKPCYCVTTTTDNRHRRDDSIANPKSSVIRVVDKLESPFSSGKK